MLAKGKVQMTIQTRHYIELSDVVALRCECRHCGAVLTLSLAKEISTRKLRRCPNCDEEWAESIEVTISNAITSLKKLQSEMEDRSSRDGGFSLTIEVKGIAAPDSK
jgi:hypothetical protein